MSSTVEVAASLKTFACILLAEPSVTAALQECLRNAQEAWQSSGFPVIVVATTVDVDKIPLSILGLFKEELSIEVSVRIASFAHKPLCTDLLSSSLVT